ncbi:aldehyde dehydrogenase family protein [Candidatus Aenigmatarchaeota archaeon]
MHHKLYIDGKWVKSNSGDTFTSINPATEMEIGTFEKGNEKDAKKAIDAAERAYIKWSETPAPKRGAILLRAAEIMRKRKRELGELVTKEMGKVVAEGISDVQEAIDTFEYFAGEGRRLFGHTTPSELKDKFAMTVRRPIGIMGLITPWNFPIAIPAWKLCPALVCGNTVVFKPSSDTPLCALEFLKILIRAGLPKGVVNFVTGSGGSVGKEIIKNKKVDGISFTGSVATGKWIRANAGLKKVGTELGGKNPILIMDDADIASAVDGVIWGAFGTTGQRCTAASRVIVHKKVKARFEKMLLTRTKKLKLGNGLRPKTDVGPLINKKALEKSRKYCAIGKNEGAKMLCGGLPLDGKGFFFKPTIFTNATMDMRIAQEEIFGPVLSIITCNSIDDAIEKANSVDYGLSSSIYTKNVSLAFEAIERIEAGLTYINSSTIGSEVHLPFGGIKNTGSTREAGITGIDEFSELKTVYVDYSGKLQKAQWD